MLEIFSRFLLQINILLGLFIIYFLTSTDQVQHFGGLNRTEERFKDLSKSFNEVDNTVLLITLTLNF